MASVMRGAPPSPLKPPPPPPFHSLSLNTTAEGISAQPSEENLRYFSVAIRGPEQSAYEGEEEKEMEGER